VDYARWLLTPAERGNPDTRIDARGGDGSWSTGNDVRPLIHGATYFAELLRAVREAAAGDMIMFTDWRGDPDQLLAGPGTEVSRVLCAAAARGVLVKGLIWRSHWDRLAFSSKENEHLGTEINKHGGECVRDMRVRPGGSHHQKFVVIRHPDRPELDVAFVGGIDLCHSRRDDASHGGDAQRQPMAAVYGDRPPWHDAMAMIRGPAVGYVEATFRERWQDPTPVTRSPLRRLADAARHDDDKAGTLPPQLPDPAPCGTATVQLLRTYPYRRRGYAFARRGERSVARGYRKAIGRARSLIYLEDQYFWNVGIVECLAEALTTNPDLHLIAVVPHYPDQDGRISEPPNLLGRHSAVDVVREAGGDRVAVYGVENHAGVPVYVHAKVCVIDDVWASIGSDNLNRRSWTHDSELSCVVVDSERDRREPQALDRDGDGARRYARALRLELAREHLDRADGDDADLIDPRTWFAAFDEHARRLQRWVDGGRQGKRPPGRVRHYQERPLARTTQLWSAPLYRVVYDPDGRPLRMRRRDEF
jgi:phosphatidylserine/phosphatidylglycerophosphate/cardiolipin synthase-like enzyme